MSEESVIQTSSTPSASPSVAVACRGAWSGFKGWWLPLCIISFLLLMTQSWIPNKVMEGLPELSVFEYPQQELESLSARATSLQKPLDLQEVRATSERIIEYFQTPEAKELLYQLFRKVILILTIASFVAIFVHLTLILVSMAACHDDKMLTHKQRVQLALKKAPKLYFSYLVLGIIKVVPWFFFIIPGFIIYIRLYFTGFIITEASTNPFLASKKSWELTRGHFGVIFVIFLITLVLDFIGVITAGIGLIPGTSVKYTLRASMYNQLLAFNEQKGEV